MQGTNATPVHCQRHALCPTNPSFAGFTLYFSLILLTIFSLLLLIIFIFSPEFVTRLVDSTDSRCVFYVAGARTAPGRREGGGDQYCYALLHEQYWVNWVCGSVASSSLAQSAVSPCPCVSHVYWWFFRNAAKHRYARSLLRDARTRHGIPTRRTRDRGMLYFLTLLTVRSCAIRGVSWSLTGAEATPHRTKLPFVPAFAVRIYECECSMAAPLYDPSVARASGEILMLTARALVAPKHRGSAPVPTWWPAQRSLSSKTARLSRLRDYRRDAISIQIDYDRSSPERVMPDWREKLAYSTLAWRAW